MALQGSGIIRASQINAELGRSSSAAISLDTAENGGYVTINSCSPSRPNSSNPASMSEWYSYNHAFACCNAPSISSVNAGTNSLTVNFSTSNCSAVHLEYSTNGSSWTTQTTGCSSPQTISGLASGTSYIVRMRITCTSTGGYSSYSNAVTMSTGASYPAYGTFLSQYCSGCTLYYRYADGAGGYYDTSQGCSGICGGCCCAPGYGTYLYAQCDGCDYYYYYADGCYGTYRTLVESNSPSCGCGTTPWCQFGYIEGTGQYMYTNCQGLLQMGEQYFVSDTPDCIDIFQPYRGVQPNGNDCSWML